MLERSMLNSAVAFVMAMLVTTLPMPEKPKDDYSHDGISRKKQDRYDDAIFGGNAKYDEGYYDSDWKYENYGFGDAPKYCTGNCIAYPKR